MRLSSLATCYLFFFIIIISWHLITPWGSPQAPAPFAPSLAQLLTSIILTAPQRCSTHWTLWLFASSTPYFFRTLPTYPFPSAKSLNTFWFSYYDTFPEDSNKKATISFLLVQQSSEHLCFASIMTSNPLTSPPSLNPLSPSPSPPI